MPGEWILGIESTAPRGSLVLLRGEEEVGAAVFEARPNHSAVLGRALAEVLAELPGGAGLAEVVVATGPGSYNGARVGIAAGQGVALVHGCATVGIPSLEAVAEVRSGRPALAVGDARRGSFFAVALDDGKVAGEAGLMDRARFEERLRAARAEGRWLFSLEDPDRLSLPGDLAGRVHFSVPEARLALAAWAGRTEPERERLRGTPPQPYHLRPPHHDGEGPPAGAMKLSSYQSLDPHLLVGMVNTELRNNAADLDDLCKTHGIEEKVLRERLAAAGYEYRPEQRQFR